MGLLVIVKRDGGGGFGGLKGLWEWCAAVRGGVLTRGVNELISASHER